MIAQPDRRSQQKQRSRDQILAAARLLVEQQRSTRFSVDELAERADVSRRTIFNHFASLDDVIVALATAELEEFVGVFEARLAVQEGPVTRERVFDAIAATLESADIAKTIAFFVRTLGTDPRAEGQADHLFHTSFNRTGVELIDAVVRASDALDGFDADIAVGHAISGLATVARHWAQETGASLDPESRERFGELLARATATWPTAR